MGRYTSYYTYQKFEKRGEQDWIPAYPNTWSIDGEGTMPLSAKTENDPACGYIPPVEPIYQWVVKDASEYICENYNKYQKLYKSVSYDNGQTWSWVVPYETMKGDLIETQSADCSYIVIYRWYQAPASDYICDGTSKYYKEYYQVSYDNGSTWQNVVPEQTRKGDLIEAQSTDCGYVPPTAQGKWLAYYSGGLISSADCDSTSTITKNEIANSDLISVSVGDCVRTIGNSAFSTGGIPGYVSTLTSVTLSNSVKYINKAAFSYCSGLTSVNIPSGVTTINDYVFQACHSLPSIDIPSGVTSIGNNAFTWCYNLHLVTLPSGLTSIGELAFGYCGSMTGNLIIPNSVTSIGSDAFFGCSGLTSVTLSNNLTELPDGAVFGYCHGLKSIGPTGSGASLEIPSSLVSIGQSTFTSCTGLTSVTIPSTVQYLGSYMFSGCTNLRTINVQNSGSWNGIIPGGMFRNCYNLLSINIPNSIVRIQGDAFYNCRSLTTVTIPSSVTFIGCNSFHSCTGLQSIYCMPTTPPQLCGTVAPETFDNTNNCPIYVPAASVNAYKSAWSPYYSDRIQAIT